MAASKIETITVRIEPAIKKTIAEQEQRSLAEMIEVLIQHYCGRNGIAIPEQDTLALTRNLPQAVSRLR